LRVLVIGGGGQVGGKVLSYCKERGIETYSTYMSRQPTLGVEHSYPLDKTDASSARKLIHTLQPQAIVDTAALHNVDYCETHKEEAWKVNVAGTRNVAEAARRSRAKIVFISTDYVFDGEKGNYSESDTPHPISEYGVTKVEAEKEVAKISNDHLIIRPSVIYSWVPESQLALGSVSGKPVNFGMWVFQKLSKGEKINAVDDQFSSPTLADILAEAIVKGIENDLTGVYHIAGKSRLSRFEFTLRLAEKMGFSRDLISRLKTSDLKQVARRPVDSSLDVSRVERDLKISLPTIEKALEVFASQSQVLMEKRQ
jgi:dTDP-4-dehydrorhamnose reductase